MEVNNSELKVRGCSNTHLILLFSSRRKDLVACRLSATTHPLVNFLLPFHFYLFIFWPCYTACESYFPDHASCSGRGSSCFFLTSFNFYIHNFFLLALLGLRCFVQAFLALWGPPRRASHCDGLSLWSTGSRALRLQ